MAENKKDQVGPSVDALIRRSLHNLSVDNKPAYGGYRTNPTDRFTFTRIGRIIEVNYESNCVTVFWIDHIGTRDEVPISHPYFGLRGHIMAMPEINSLAVVGFLHGIRPYILTYLPANYRMMVELTQFPDRIEDLNFSTEQLIKTQVEIKDDYDVTSLTGKAIRDIKDLEIEARIAQHRLEEFSISKPLLEPGEIEVASVYGAAVRWDTDLTCTDMNGDEIKLRAEDNTIEVTTRDWIKHTDFGQTREGQVLRPFSIREPRRVGEATESNPFIGTLPPDAISSVVDPMLDKIFYPIGKIGRLDLRHDELKTQEWDLTYQYKVNKQLPFVERLVTCNEFSEATLFINGQQNLIPLPESEQFTISKLQVTSTDAADQSEQSKSGSEKSAGGIVQFDFTPSSAKIEFAIDVNPFRPIENKYPTIRKEAEKEAFALRKDSLFNNLTTLLGINKDKLKELYQSLVELPGVSGVESQAERDKLKSDVEAQENADTVTDEAHGKTGLGTTPKDKLLALRNKLKKRIASQQLGFVSSDAVINDAYAGFGEPTGTGRNTKIAPIGPLFRTEIGTLVDGHDRMIKDPFSFERISMQVRQATGMFVNVDRRGSINANCTTLLVNTVGMSLYSGYAHRKICEIKVADKYVDSKGDDPQPNAKIYLPEPIPANTLSQAGRILNIQPKDSKNGSDPRNRENPSKGVDPLKFQRSDIGQIPGPAETFLPPPDQPAMKPGQAEASQGAGNAGGAGAQAPGGAAGAKSLAQNILARSDDVGGGTESSPSSGPGAAPGSASGGSGGSSGSGGAGVAGSGPQTPITYLNEFQIKIPREAKIKPMNDIVDPSIIGYDPPRTKEIDLYSFQVDKKLNEKLNPELKVEAIDYDKMARNTPYVEITAANLIDRDGTIIRSSMTQNPIALDVSINVGEKPATHVVDHEGNVDDTFNNIYQSFNSGFVEYGQIFKISRDDEQVEVRMEAEDDGVLGTEKKPNDVQKKESCRKEKRTRKAFKREVFHDLGHITFKVNSHSSSGVRTEVKTPTEIEKLPKWKKIEERELRAPIKNIPEDPDVQLSMGSVVDGNHTETPNEAIGFMNKKLHYRIKKKIIDDSLVGELSGATKKLLSGDSTGVTDVIKALAKKAQAIAQRGDRGFESTNLEPSPALQLVESTRSFLSNLEQKASAIAGPQPNDKADAPGPKVDTAFGFLLRRTAAGFRTAVQAGIDKITPSYESLLAEKAAAENKILASNKAYLSELKKKCNKIVALDFSQKIALDVLGRNQINSDTDLLNAELTRMECNKTENAVALILNTATPSVIEPAGVPGIGLPSKVSPPKAKSKPAVKKGLPFPIGLTGNPASEVKTGTSIALPPAVAAGTRAPGDPPGTDFRFPTGGIIGPDGKIIAGQSRMQSGQAVDPRTGRVYTGPAFGSGGCVIDASGRLVPTLEITNLSQINPFGFLSYPLPVQVPIGTAIGPDGTLDSMPSPGQAGNPNNNDPIVSDSFLMNLNDFIASELPKGIEFETPVVTETEITIDTAEKNWKEAQISSYSLLSRSDDVGGGSGVSSGGIGSGVGPSTAAPANANPSAGNTGVFPGINKPVDGPASGSVGVPEKVTIVEIDDAGDWAVKSNIEGVNQTIINPLAQLQLGNVIDKDKTNAIQQSVSLKGPFVEARLSLKNGAGFDLDRAGNLIGFATNDFLLRSLVNGEVRSYGDLKIISDRRSVIIQAEGGSVLEDKEAGKIEDPGFTGLPKAELVIGRAEQRNGDRTEAIVSAWGHEIRAAMMVHVNEDERSVMGIDAGGNFVFESNVANRSHTKACKNALESNGGASQPDADGKMKEVKSATGASIHKRTATKSDDGKKTEIQQDGKGSIYGYADFHVHWSARAENPYPTGTNAASLRSRDAIAVPGSPAPPVSKSDSITTGQDLTKETIGCDVQIGKVLSPSGETSKDVVGLLGRVLNYRVRKPTTKQATIDSTSQAITTAIVNGTPGANAQLTAKIQTLKDISSTARQVAANSAAEAERSAEQAAQAELAAALLADNDNPNAESHMRATIASIAASNARNAANQASADSKTATDLANAADKEVQNTLATVGTKVYQKLVDGDRPGPDTIPPYQEAGLTDITLNGTVKKVEPTNNQNDRDIATENTNQTNKINQLIEAQALTDLRVSFPTFGVSETLLAPRAAGRTGIDAQGFPIGAGVAIGETQEEINDIGDWTCKSDIAEVNQSLLNPQAQLQLGRVIAKNEDSGKLSLVSAKSILGPISRARLSLPSGTGLDLDALGNFIGYATHRFLLKADLSGEVRTYDDLKLISDHRSVVIQGNGGDVLQHGEQGSMAGGLQTAPKSELILGRWEKRVGTVLDNPPPGSPRKNSFNNDYNIALIRHDGLTNRTMFSIDSGSNAILEATALDKTVMIKSPELETQYGKVVDFKVVGTTPEADDAKSAFTPFGNKVRYRMKMDKDGPASGTFIQIDDVGNIAQKTAHGKTTLIKSTGDGEIQLGRVLDITGTDDNPNAVEAISAETGNKIKYRVKMDAGTRMEIDEFGNAVLFVGGRLEIISDGHINIESRNSAIDITSPSQINLNAPIVRRSGNGAFFN